MFRTIYKHKLLILLERNLIVLPTNLGEEYDLRQVIATAVTRESSMANAEAVKVQGQTGQGGGR